MPPLVTVTLRNTWFKLEAVYDERFVAALKEIPGAQFRRSADDSAYWILPVEARGAFEELVAARLAVVDGTIPTGPDPITTRLAAPPALRQYQRDGCMRIHNILTQYKGALLADDPGLGKSAQALHAIAGRPPALIVAPAVVLTHWQREVLRWTGERSHIIRKPADIENAPGLNHWIVSYDIMRKCPAELAKLSPSCVIFDEIHYLSNSRTGRSKAARQLAAALPAYAWVLGLSGTPMTTRPKDLYNVLDILFPGRFGTFFSFARRYCDAHQVEVARDKTVWQFDGASRTTELAVRMAPFMVRRSRTEVLTELPPRSRVLIPVEAARGARSTMIKVSAVTGVNPRALEDWLRVTEQNKVKPAVELARDLRDSGENPLIFTMTRAVAHKIATALGTTAVTGEDPPDQRRERLEASLKLQGVGVATMYSVTTGIDLVGFDSAIFVGLDWVPANLLQAEGRIHRLGQRRAVTIYYLIVSGTVDDAIRYAVIERLTTFDMLFGAAAEQRGLRKDLGTAEDHAMQSIAAAILGMVQGKWKGAL